MEVTFDSLMPLSVILITCLFLPWLIFHYISQIRAAKYLDQESQELFEHTVQKVETMEDRIHTLERILDSEVPDWRNRS